MQEWFSQNAPTSYYSTEALKATLEQLVDFDLINNSKDMRLSVGAASGRLIATCSDSGPPVTRRRRAERMLETCAGNPRGRAY